MRNNNFTVYTLSLVISALLIICFSGIETSYANSTYIYKSAYNPSIKMRRSNFETIFTTVGYLRPTSLHAISANTPSTYAKPGIYIDHRTPVKTTFDDAFIGVGAGSIAGTLFSLIFGDDIIDDDELHVDDTNYDDDESSEMAGAVFFVVFIALAILIKILKGYVVKLIGKKNADEEKKAAGAVSCLGGTFFYIILPLAIIIATAFIPWKPTPDLRHAAAAGDMTQIQERIAKEENININTNTGVWTPLAYAAEHGHLAAVKELLKHNPTLYLTPLVATASSGHKAVWETLVTNTRYSAWLNGQAEQFFEIFNAAAKDNNLAMLEYLYATPLLQNVPNILNYALVEASLKGQTKAVDWLLAKGADVNFATPTDGFTPLMMAAATNNMALVKKFISLGANVQAKARITQESALSAAIYHSYTPIVQLLQSTSAKNL